MARLKREAPGIGTVFMNIIDASGTTEYEGRKVRIIS
jgi:hypothetical protein